MTMVAYSEPPRFPPTGGRERRKGAPIRHEDQRVMVFGLAYGWTLGQIARCLSVNNSTVWKFRQRLTKEPSLILGLHLVSKEGQKRFRCLLCKDIRSSRVKAWRHVMDHVLPHEMARDYPVGKFLAEML